MLVIVTISMMFTEFKETAFQMLSTKMKRFWNKWELRGMLLLSLTFQIVLVRYGSRRKIAGKATPRIAILVWSTYLLADSVPIFSLSALMRSQEEAHTTLVPFWAPFLLLHLGGPDTITAYSLEDNDLWLRHLLGLCIPTLQASYVQWKFYSNISITILAFLIFVAGIIKCGERIWILRNASSKKFKNSVFSTPEPKFEEVTEMSRTEERVDLDTHLSRAGISPDVRYLHEAYLLFKVFKPLFSDLTLRLYKELHAIFTIKFISSARAFKLVQVELGFLYDVLYTKRTILRHPEGAILRSICFLSSCTALVFFFFFIHLTTEIHSKVDIYVSYTLLFGAVALDIYSVIVYALSDWAMLWVTRHKNWLANFVYRANSSRFVSRNGKVEFLSMPQYNLISFVLKSKKSKLRAIEGFLDTDSVLSKYRYITWEQVNFDLKEMIYSHLLEKHKQYEDGKYEYRFINDLLDKRGNGILTEKNILEEFRWSTNEVEFNHSLLLWHFATDLCYYADGNKYGTDILGSHYKMSKLLSDYMLYLLVMCPFMLPKGISEVRFRDTCQEVKRFLQNRNEFDSITASIAFLYDSQDRPPNLQIPGKSKSVLFNGVYLANQLQLLETDNHWDHEEKWEMISHVWVEMLTYAASHCGWKEHAQQLKRGSELLTHVSLLMAHLGLTEKIHIVSLPQELETMDYKPPWNWDSLKHLAYYLA